ncbi:MAG: ATP-binding protein, partial [Thermomicrobiales bacterium]
MVNPLDRPVVCPILVGREAHVEALARCLDEARAGGGQTLLVTGEAGIGKSRLVAEARALAAARGLLTLQGSCFESDRMLPYAPVVDLLRDWLAAAPTGATDEIVGPAAGALSTLLPELAARLPTSSPSPPEDPQQERHRRVHALTGVVLRLAESRPVLVVVEDLHWCDETSLDWLRVLARRIQERPIVLLLTYRDDEMPDVLAHAMAELDRLRLAAELRLTPLSTGEVGVMLRAVFDLERRALFDPSHLARAGVAAMLHDLTEGNPFFIEEVLRSLVAGGEIRRGDGGWDAVPLNELRVKLPRSAAEAVRRRSA